MDFKCAKTEDCFAESYTYEYRLPISGGVLAERLPDWSLRKNMKLRRPVFVAERGGVTVKGVLDAQSVRASFPQATWEADKAAFEKYLEGMDV